MLTLVLAATALATPAPIVGGTETDLHPEVGALVITLDDWDVLYCSGVLVAPDRVLTAGHCTADFDALADTGWTIRFLAGTDIGSEDTVEASADAVGWTTHERYGSGDYDNDLGVVELEAALAIPPATLNEASPADWSDLTFVGWGSTSTANGDAGTKREVSLAVLGVDTQRIRAWDEGGSGLCFGDSGGAALGSDGTLAGVNSYIYSLDGAEKATCEDAAAAAVRVDAYLEWITAVVAGETPPPSNGGPVYGPPFQGGQLCGSTRGDPWLLGVAMLAWRRRRSVAYSATVCWCSG